MIFKNSEIQLLALGSYRINIQIHNSFSAMNSDCIEVDELMRQLASYKNDDADVAAEKLLRQCWHSWEAYQYLENHTRDACLPDSAR